MFSLLFVLFLFSFLSSLLPQFSFSFLSFSYLLPCWACDNGGLVKSFVLAFVVVVKRIFFRLLLYYSAVHCEKDFFRLLLYYLVARVNKFWSRMISKSIIDDSNKFWSHMIIKVLLFLIVIVTIHSSPSLPLTTSLLLSLYNFLHYHRYYFIILLSLPWSLPLWIVSINFVMQSSSRGRGRNDIMTSLHLSCCMHDGTLESYHL